MAELVIGAAYPARRNGQIAVKMSESKALMVYIPFSLIGVEYSGVHSICIGTKDGALQEVALQNLHDIFGWKTENPFDLQRLPLPESQEAEFQLSDWHNEPYTPKGKAEQVDKYCFRWLNKLSAGTKPATEDEESSAMEVWGSKFSVAPSTPKKTEAKTPEKKATPKRTLAAKAPARVLTAESLLTLIAHKKGIDENDQDAMNTFGNDIYFPLTDKLFGAGNLPETQEQLEQVAKEFGV